jgi:DMSO reductase anchor subunit
MPHRLSRTIRRWHEWPLVLFSALSIGGAGIAVAIPVARPVGWLDRAAEPGLWFISGMMVGTAILVSVFHLGRIWRSHYALRRIGFSPLSTEIFLAAILVPLALAQAISTGLDGLSPLLPYLSGLAALSVLLLIGLVYNLDGQLSWKGPAAAIPLIQGMAFGLTVVLAVSLGESDYRGSPGPAALIVIDGGIHLLRWKKISNQRTLGTPSHPEVVSQWKRLLLLRSVISHVLPLVAILVSLPAVAMALLAVGIVHERVLFYALASQHTHEAEIARVDEVIRHL